MDTVLFVTLAPVAAIPLAVVAVVAWRRRAVAGGRALAALSACGLAWLVGNTASVLAPGPETTIAILRAMYLVLPFFVVSWLAFALSYTDRLTRRTRWAVVALAVVSVGIDGLVLTNDLHGLIWRALWTVRDGPFLAPQVEFGPGSIAVMVLMWSVLVLALGLVLQAYAHAPRSVHQTSRWIVVGAAVPLVMNALFFVNHFAELIPVRKDFTPIGLAVSSGVFAVGLFRYRLLDLRPVARAALVERLPEGVLVLDAQDRIVDANPAMRALLDAPGDLVGRSIHDVVTPAQAEAARVLHGRHDAHAEIPFERDGEVRYYDVRVSPLEDRRGRPTGHLVLLQDVTQRRAQETALQAANDALQAQNAHLDAFAHTVAHDLKNPILGVLGYAEMLAEEDVSDSFRRRAAETIAHSARTMDTIVHEILLLAGVTRREVELARFATRPVVEAALARVAHRLDAAGATVDGPDRWPVAIGHAPWVEEIWANYLSNAAKYGGPAPRVELGAEAAGDAVRFWVRDAGPGLSAEDQARLFVPFSRVTTEAVDGHGLGLSIVRQIAERLGGACGVESAPGEGARFWFELPAASDAAVADRASLATASG